MIDDDPTETPQSDPFGSQLENLATAIEGRPAIDVEQAPETGRSRQIYWLIGGLCALTIGIAEIGILARGESVGAPPPPAELMARVESDPCATRTAAFMKAVSAYAEAHGEPPPNLAVLTPDYIAFPPIDPTSNLPFSYQVVGESVSITCPSAAPSAAPASHPKET